MRIISVEINNILSIENATLSFNESGLVLVDGWNYDIGRANGAGKTTLFNGISFAIFDKVPRKVTATEILRRGATTGFSRCVLVSGQDTWEVIRRRPKGVEFIKNGVRADITQKEFEASIRLTYDQFLLTMYTAQSTNGGTDRFLIKSDTDKKTFLLRLLDLEKFSACKKVADAKIKVLTADVDSLKSNIANNVSKIAAYRDSLTDEEALNVTLLQLNSSISNVTKEYNDLASEQEPDIAKYLKLEDDIRSKLNEIIKARTKREMLHEQYKRIHSDKTLQQGASGTCSECGSPLNTPELVKRHLDNHSRNEQRLNDINVGIGECDGVIANENSIHDLARRLKEKKNKETAAFTKATARRQELKIFLRDKETQRSYVEHQIAMNSDLAYKINNLVLANDEVQVQMDSKKNELHVFEELANIYSPTGAQAYVLDSIVDLFNETIGEYINIVWPNASYEIQSQKENSKGEMVAKFSETLMMGKSEVSVGSLSGGEFKAFSLCVDFTLLNILAKQFGIDLNPIILDEPFDGLDAVGKRIVINLLLKLSKDKQIIVVDHASEAKSLFPMVIQVDKRNDISTVSIEA